MAAFGTPSLAYLLGALVGDGSTKKRKDGQLYAVLRVKDRDFAEKFASIVNSCLKRSVNVIPEQNLHAVYVSSKLLVNLIRDKTFERIAERWPCPFLQGLFDADGSICYALKGNRLHKAIDFSNTDKALVRLVQRLLERLDIHYTMRARTDKLGQVRVAPDGHIIKSKKLSYDLKLRTKKALLIFYRAVGFSIKRKAMKLETLVVLMENH